MVVVALGKAGSCEMMAGSDLDLMLVYDHPETVTESVLSDARRLHGTGLAPDVRRRCLPVSQYYTRLAHSLIAALSAPGEGGPLYALDMRLRPSGGKGPVAVSLTAFRRYHAERSWTWERMALSRARVVAGPGPMRVRVTAAIGQALDQPGAAREILLGDACAMRARVAAELPARSRWDVKRREGGLMEVEFIAQILQLASRDHGLRHPTTRVALRRLAKGGVMKRADADMLIGADRFWRAVQSMLRILFGTVLPRQLEDATAPELEALLHGVAASCTPRIEPAAGLAGLEQHMDHVSGAVRAAFIRLIGEPQAAAADGIPARLAETFLID